MYGLKTSILHIFGKNKIYLDALGRQLKLTKGKRQEATEKDGE